MHTRRTTRLRQAATVAALVMMVALGACSDDDPRAAQPEITAPTSTTTTTQATTTSTAPTPDRLEAEPPPDEPRPDIDVNVTYPSTFTEAQIEVVEAYRGYWHAAYLMNDPCGPTPPGEPAACLPDPDDELIERYATGASLQAVRDNTSASLEQGRVVVIPPAAAYRHSVMQVTVDGQSAELVACAIDDAVVLDVDGGVVDDRVLTSRYAVTLTEDGGDWKVSGDIETLRQWTGEEAELCESDV
jgi:hypothetical protein